MRRSRFDLAEGAFMGVGCLVVLVWCAVWATIIWAIVMVVKKFVL